MLNVQPIEPAASYVGGKKILSSRICKIIETVPHKLYAEPFVGMGGVFFRRRLAPKLEVINDRSGDISNFFRILQRHYPQLMDTLKFQITSRREFERLKAANPETLTDLERAARFIYMQKIAFGGIVNTRSFGISYDCEARFNLSKLAPMLEDIHERLSGVIIENLDWTNLIDRYDRQGTLFYCDPPYWGSEHYYGKDLFNKEQFALMADRLGKLKGSFIMSINDVAEIRKLFSAFLIHEVKVSYSCCGGTNINRAKELIITNFPEV